MLYDLDIFILELLSFKNKVKNYYFNIVFITKKKKMTKNKILLIFDSNSLRLLEIYGRLDFFYRLIFKMAKWRNCYTYTKSVILVIDN